MKNIVLQIKNRREGFTLVEMLVSLAIFSIIVIAAVGSLYTVNQAAKRVSAMRTVLDNLDFATESMSRTIRTADGISCGTPSSSTLTPGSGVDCAFGSTADAEEITLNSTLGADIGSEIDYRWRMNGTNGEIQKCSVTNGNVDDCVAITAPQINITSAHFYVNGAADSDQLQPSVMIMIQGVANAGGSSGEPFAVQTLVSQRTSE
jgi:prepilin-type N-terminal cleavage/methylation domain-containing protein